MFECQAKMRISTHTCDTIKPYKNMVNKMCANGKQVNMMGQCTLYSAQCTLLAKQLFHLEFSGSQSQTAFFQRAKNLNMQIAMKIE